MVTDLDVSRAENLVRVPSALHSCSVSNAHDSLQNPYYSCTLKTNENKTNLGEKFQQFYNT